MTKCEPPKTPEKCKHCGEPLDSHICAECGGCWVFCKC